MILKLRLRYSTGGVYFFLTALVVSLCVIFSKYYETGLTTRLLKAPLEKESSLKTTGLIVNNSKTPHEHKVQTLTSNELELNKTYEKKTASIDLDDVKPPIDFLFHKLTLVTSFSQNHFQEGLGFIGSAQQHMPNKTIIVYDLGLQEEAVKKIRSLCNVELRRFPFENYPAHLKRIGTYAFKPTIINLVLDEFGVVYYGDSSIRFKKSLRELFPECLAHHGLLGHIRCFDPKFGKKYKNGCLHDYHLTMNEVYAKVGVNKSEYYSGNFSSPAVSAGLMLLVNSTTIQSKIMKPWLRCALDVTCIAPTGASLKNHRFDQSALSLTIFKNMRGEWTLENDPTPHHLAVIDILRGTNGADWHPKSCG